MIWYVLFSSLIFVYCTVLARIDFLSKKAILILAIYMILIDSTISLNHGQISTVFKVGGSLFYLLYKSKEKKGNVLLFMALYSIVIVVDYISTNLLNLIWNISFDDIHHIYFTGYSLLYVAITFTLCAGIRYLFIEKWHLNKKMQLFNKSIVTGIFFQMLVYIFMLVINIIYGGYVGYPDNMLQINGLFFTIYFVCNCLIFRFVYKVLLKDQKLKVQIAEQTYLKEYTEKLEALYDETRIFRHDYVNIMLTMKEYIEDEEWEKLKLYFETKIEPFYKKQDFSLTQVKKLSNLEIPELKGLFFGKCLQMLYRGVDLTLDIPSKIRKIEMDLLDLCRVIGIFLDNAVEAAEITESKKVNVNFEYSDERVSIVIQNDTIENGLEITELCRKGITSKAGHSGLGLYEVNRILEKYENVEWLMSSENDVFEQRLIIYERGV